MPADWPSTADSGVIEYGLVDIGGPPFLMPLHAEAIIVFQSSGKHRTLTEFGSYRKFSTDTKIEFEKQ